MFVYCCKLFLLLGCMIGFLVRDFIEVFIIWNGWLNWFFNVLRVFVKLFGNVLYCWIVRSVGFFRNCNRWVILIVLLSGFVLISCLNFWWKEGYCWGDLLNFWICIWGRLWEVFIFFIEDIIVVRFLFRVVLDILGVIVDGVLIEVIKVNGCDLDFFW